MALNECSFQWKSTALNLQGHVMDAGHCRPVGMPDEISAQVLHGSPKSGSFFGCRLWRLACWVPFFYALSKNHRGGFLHSPTLHLYALRSRIRSDSRS